MRLDEASSAPRVLIYSHDTFGLGHLRRSRAIANAIVACNRGAQAMIVSGSPVVDRFAFAPGVRTVRLPPVTKFADGNYASLDAATPSPARSSSGRRSSPRPAEPSAPT